LKTVPNQLIELLPQPYRDQLLARCELVPLLLGTALCERDAVMRHVYFPSTGFLSLVAQIDGHPGLEIGMVGREGMVGASLALGVSGVPLRVLVQGSGTAWRMAAGSFKRELARSAALHRFVDRYLYVMLSQIAASAGCLRFHLIPARLARWLLMSQDRAQADHFHITHELLATMLGVRRVGITVAATALQRQGLIRYHRGELTVLDRTGLEAVSCSCYAAARLSYAQQFPDEAASASRGKALAESA
jgi:CRP-like cAMP-binding protein